MSKTIIHPQHCCCESCAPNHPSRPRYPGAFSFAVIVALTIAGWIAVFWAASELRDCLTTWTAI